MLLLPTELIKCSVFLLVRCKTTSCFQICCMFSRFLEEKLKLLSLIYIFFSIKVDTIGPTEPLIMPILLMFNTDTEYKLLLCIKVSAHGHMLVHFLHNFLLLQNFSLFSQLFQAVHKIQHSDIMCRWTYNAVYDTRL